MCVRWPRMKNPTVWTAVLVVLGLGLRSFHYFREPAIWHDEAALIVNVLGKSFLQQLGPLHLAEAAPPLFLWAEKATVTLLGDDPLAFRLVPFAASCLALLLLVPIARRFLQPEAVPWAVLLFAGSEQLLWHGCEAKPYSVDVLAAVLVLAVFKSLRDRSLGGTLAAYTLLAPLVILTCYPGCFLFGGVLVTLLPAVARAKRLRLWVGYGLLAATVLLTFTWLALGPVRAQRCGTLERCWTDMFPKWDQPWTVPLWSFISTVEICRYCCKPLGQPLALLAAVGGVLLWRQGRRELVALLVTPVALALVASGLKAYPYGGSRVLVYAAPAVVLLIAAGTPSTLLWVRSRTRLGSVAVTGLLLLPLGMAGIRLLVPWDRCQSDVATAYVLAHRRPWEPVVGNHWEYLYYFRHIGAQFRMLTAELATSPGISMMRVNDQAAEYQIRDDVVPGNIDRFWVIATGLCLGDRLKLLEELPRTGWREVLRREFNHITVVLVERGESGLSELGRSDERAEGHKLTEMPASPDARTAPGS